MKKNFKNIFRTVGNVFDRIAVLEAKRVFALLNATSPKRNRSK